METPRQLQSAARQREAITIAHREYDDEQVIAIDFGPTVEASVDVVGETAIVIAGELQFEFDVPPEATEIETNDGILRIESDR